MNEIRPFPVHHCVLGLCGGLNGVPEYLVTEERRLNSMRNCRKHLQKMTGQDFGYDALAWHKYFLNSDEGVKCGYLATQFGYRMEEFIAIDKSKPYYEKLYSKLVSEDEIPDV